LATISSSTYSFGEDIIYRFYIGLTLFLATLFSCFVFIIIGFLVCILCLCQKFYQKFFDYFDIISYFRTGGNHHHKRIFQKDIEYFDISNF
jgi:hypothetical protein